MSLLLRTSRRRALLLAGALVIAQWALAQHLAQFEAHAPGEVCEWCLTHAPLASALPATAAALPPPAAEPRRSAPATPAPVAGARLVPAARGPPSLPIV